MLYFGVASFDFIELMLFRGVVRHPQIFRQNVVVLMFIFWRILSDIMNVIFHFEGFFMDIIRELFFSITFGTWTDVSHDIQINLKNE